MPTTYSFIAGTTLTATTTTVTFSSIPSTYTDLVLKAETRITDPVVGVGSEIYPNNATSGTYYRVSVFGDSATGGRSVSGNSAYAFYNAGDNNSANAFSINEIYFANYTSTTLNKTYTAKVGTADNQTSANYMGWAMGLYESTSAISSLTLSTTTYIWKTGSSFTLYGILKA